MDKFEINFTYTKYGTLNPLVFWKSLPGGQVVMIPPHSPPSDKMIDRAPPQPASGAADGGV